MTVLSQLGITVLNELKLLNTHINYEKKLAGLEAEEEEEEEKDEVRTEQTMTSVKQSIFNKTIHVVLLLMISSSCRNEKNLWAQFTLRGGDSLKHFIITYG